jgi:hypothetical protein
VNLTRSSLLSACLFFALPTLAFAQQAKPAAPAPAAPAAAEADAYAPDHIAAARQVVLTSGIANTFSLFYPQLADQAVNALTRTRPEIRTDLIAVLKQLEPEFSERKEEVIKATSNAFAGAMSAKDLKDTAAFFASDAGKAYVAMQPKVINQMVLAIDAWNRQLSTDLMVRVREEMKKKGIQL